MRRAQIQQQIITTNATKQRVIVFLVTVKTMDFTKVSQRSPPAVSRCTTVSWRPWEPPHSTGQCEQRPHSSSGSSGHSGEALFPTADSPQLVSHDGKAINATTPRQHRAPWWGQSPGALRTATSPLPNPLTSACPPRALQRRILIFGKTRLTQEGAGLGQTLFPGQPGELSVTRDSSCPVMVPLTPPSSSPPP